VSFRGCSERKDEGLSLCNPDFVCTDVSLKDVDPLLPFLFSISERTGENLKMIEFATPIRDLLVVEEEQGVNVLTGS
jgi:hypothetical protein